MALVVEDGSGKADANSYASLTDLQTFFGNRGWSYNGFTPEEQEAALVAATDYIERRSRWSTGTKGSKEQALSWPRSGAYDRHGYLIDSDEVPTAVVNATLEGAHLVLAGSTLVSPETQKVVEQRVEGAVSVRYSDSAPATTRWTPIDTWLTGLVSSFNQAVMERA